MLWLPLLSPRGVFQFAVRSMAFFLFCFWFLIFVILSQSLLVIPVCLPKARMLVVSVQRVRTRFIFFFLCLLSFGVSLMVDLEVCL